MRNEVLDRPLWFLNARYQCNATFMSKLTRLTEPTSFNVMAAFAMKMVGRGWILSGISAKIGEFSADSAEASGCRSTPTVGPCVRFGRWFRKLVEPGKAYCIVYRTELCYSDRGAVVFTGHASSDRSEPTETLSRVFRFYLALSGMMPAYSCNNMLDSSVAPTIIYWTAYGCIKFCNLVAYNCTRQSYNSQVLFWNYCYRICKHSTFKRLFHNW